jgi:hypothetical protein
MKSTGTSRQLCPEYRQLDETLLRDTVLRSPKKESRHSTNAAVSQLAEFKNPSLHISPICFFCDPNFFFTPGEMLSPNDDVGEARPIDCIDRLGGKLARQTDHIHLDFE